VEEYKRLPRSEYMRNRARKIMNRSVQPATGPKPSALSRWPKVLINGSIDSKTWGLGSTSL
jgi:hypothetical protein